MANDARIVLQQRLTQQLVMTPQLRQAIKILQVSRAELETLIDQELTENPILEEQQADEKVETEPTVDGQSASEEWQPDSAQPEVPRRRPSTRSTGRSSRRTTATICTAPWAVQRPTTTTS